MRVLDVVFELNYFKVEISAILKRHFCHSNGSSVIVIQKFNSLDVKNARCATRIHNKVSETFSDRKIYLKHELSTASLQSSTGKLILNMKLFYAIRSSAANILHRANLPKHKNTTVAERKALEVLKKDETRVVMKADKGNCSVVMDKKEYDEKMEVFLSDPNTYNKVTKPPFKKLNVS